MKNANGNCCCSILMLMMMTTTTAGAKKMYWLSSVQFGTANRSRSNDPIACACRPNRSIDWPLSPSWPQLAAAGACKWRTQDSGRAAQAEGSWRQTDGRQVGSITRHCRRRACTLLRVGGGSPFGARSRGRRRRRSRRVSRPHYNLMSRTQRSLAIGSSACIRLAAKRLKS